MRRADLALLALPATLAAAQAPLAAQMRGGQPVTLPAPPPPPDPALMALDRFRMAYARVGSPRIIVFWNQEFSDEVASEYEDKLFRDATTNEQETEVSEETSGPAGAVATRDRNLIRREISEETAATKRVRQKRAQLVSEPVMWQMEENFHQTLDTGGAVVVDRNLAMRRTGLSANAGERANVQAIEMEALSANADIVVEVLMTPDSRAPDGISFRLSARDLRSGRMIVNFITAGRPHVGPLPLVAGPGGFVRAGAPEPGPGEVASQLAIELLDALARGLR